MGNARYMVSIKYNPNLIYFCRHPVDRVWTDLAAGAADRCMRVMTCCRILQSRWTFVCCCRIQSQQNVRSYRLHYALHLQLKVIITSSLIMSVQSKNHTKVGRWKCEKGKCGTSKCEKRKSMEHHKYMYMYTVFQKTKPPNFGSKLVKS